MKVLAMMAKTVDHELSHNFGWQHSDGYSEKNKAKKIQEYIDNLHATEKCVEDKVCAKNRNPMTVLNIFYRVKLGF